MSVEDYVTEDGTGLLQDVHVRDLLPPPGSAVKLLLILESPHAEELVERTPVVGAAGQSAIEYLLGRPGGSLGQYVDAMHAAGDFRVGVMNVSNVPLQREAYDDDAGPLTPDQWEVIRVVRESRSWKVDGTMTPEANRIGLIVQAGLQARISRLTFEPGARVALCGDVVQRFARGLTGLPSKPLKVYHPSRNHWMNNPDREEHKELRDLFLASTAPMATP